MSSTCFLCGGSIRRQLGFNPGGLTPDNRRSLRGWKRSWTRALCQLLDVSEVKGQSLLESMEYCFTCHELLFKAEFLVTTIARLQGQLQELKGHVKGLVGQYSHKARDQRRKVLDQIRGLEGTQKGSDDTKVTQTQGLLPMSPSLSKSRLESDLVTRLPQGDTKEEAELSWAGFENESMAEHFADEQPMTEDFASDSRLQEEDSFDFEKDNSNFENANFRISNLKNPKESVQNSSKLCPNSKDQKTKTNVTNCDSDSRQNGASHSSPNFRFGKKEPTRLLCSICSKLAFGKYDLERHLKTVHSLSAIPNPDGTASCPICQKSLNGKNGVRSHMGRNHATREPSSSTPPPIADPECSICSKRFSSSDEVVQHEILHASNIADPFFCVLCPAQCTSVVELRGHVLSDHEIGLLFKCNRCTAMLSTEKKLRIHLKKSHFVGATKSLLRCPQCPFQAVYPSIIKDHARCHGERAFKCDIERCGKSFHRKNTLNKHQGKVHGLAEPKNHCLLCDRLFHSLAALRVHQNSHGALRPYMCEQCSAAFKTVRTLRSHMLVHQKTVGARTNVKLQRPRKARVVATSRLLQNAVEEK